MVEVPREGDVELDQVRKRPGQEIQVAHQLGALLSLLMLLFGREEQGPIPRQLEFRDQRQMLERYEYPLAKGIRRRTKQCVDELVTRDANRVRVI